MGKKLTKETVEKYARLETNSDIYNHNNPYGYKLNVNHPLIRPMYERYKEKLGERILSDAQRLTFEVELIAWIDSKIHKRKVE